jgi:hypothetical protein
MDDDGLMTGSRSQQLSLLRQSVLSNKELWGWGASDGLIPWSGRGGATVIALWRSESRAVEENLPDPEAEPDERAIRFSTSELLERIPSWTKAGVKGYGLEARGEDILYSLNPEEFSQFLVSGRASAPRLP